MGAHDNIFPYITILWLYLYDYMQQLNLTLMSGSPTASNYVADWWRHVKSLHESTAPLVDSWSLQFIGQEELCESSLENCVQTKWQVYDIWRII